MQLHDVRVVIPEDANVIIGASHFIKTVDDLAEIVTTGVPSALFGLAFNEASGPCLVRAEGNDEALRAHAAATAQEIGAGHTFVLFIKNAFPINILNAIKDCPEVCRVFCATANPLEVVVAESAQGRGILGVIDGSAPKGIEGETDRQWRKDFLRKIGYKR